MKTWKRLAAFLLCGSMVLALGACAENANTNPGTDPSTNPSASDPSASSGNNIVVAAASLGSTLNPWDQTDGTTSAFQYAAYDRLVQYKTTTDANGNAVADTANLEGVIAESWETSEDQLTWTFHIDPDATFANGDKVLAEDVIWSYEHARDGANSSFLFGLTNIIDMQAPDDATVVFTLSQKSHMFLRLLETYPFCIVNQDEAEAGIAEDPDYLTTHTAGSGPYEITTYDITNSVVLTARDNYWGADKPANDSVTWQLVQEPSNRQLLLENGDVDVALNLDDKNINTVAEMDGIQVVKNASNMHLYLAMNLNIEPFDNVLVRQAIAYAIPYDTLVNDVMFGNATRTTSMLPDNVTGHISDDKTCYQTDLEKAKELLAEAGYPDGFTCTLTLGNGFTDWKDTAITIQDALSKIGITMEINEIDRATFLTEIANKNTALFINRFNPFIGDPGYLVNNLYVNEAAYNYNNYNNEEFDALYFQAESADTEEERMECYKEMQYIYAEDCPSVQLYQYDFAYCARDNISGYVFYPDLTLRFEFLSKG
ncbi:Glutathione-binding protein gsiB precursor [uncultured Flavonifractor sp.]|nr:Glutathione-binding protein gsiB precursor [uncultured Flavonifractor sp.]